MTGVELARVTLLVLAAIPASYRLTRIVVKDTIFDGTRNRLELWAWNRHSLLGAKFAELITCPWCSGVWVSFVLACAVLGRWPWQLGLVGWVLVFTIAGGQAILSYLEALTSTLAKDPKVEAALRRLVDLHDDPSGHSDAGLEVATANAWAKAREVLDS